MSNTVELLGFYGSDEVIACSAWTSTSRELTEDKKARIPALINFLWSNGHETPFEKATVHFLVDCDIASHIHLLKHRMASINAESARYKELKEDKFYVPTEFYNLGYDESNISYSTQHLFRKIDTWGGILEEFTNISNELYHECLTQLTPVLGRKRAKESARFFKTYNSQIQADVMFNMRSFANFLKLRNSEHAQVEIREIAQQMLDLVKSIEGNPFEQTIKSITNGK
jgi:thymidylate synthase (FAD)